jgi:EAL domain-containing protein (putative c-di-GMP-specific phosphodiesterase class I)/CheY-like chemotaxis protein
MYAQQQLATEPESVPSSVSPAIRPETDRAVRVLIVDDESAIARVMTRYLTKAGNNVTTASSGSEALRLIESGGFDAVVSDVRMAGMDGIALLRAIRSRDLDLPVVFMTGSPEMETAVAAIEHGAFRYLLKPVDGNILVDLVARAAQGHRLAVVRREVGEALQGKKVGDRANLEARFASGVEKMWMAMQPVVSWSKRTVHAYEALLRTDEASLRNPLDFLDSADQLGRSAELGKRVRERIAAQMPNLPPGANMFVNICPVDLVDEALCGGTDALTPFASRVVLEVTERAALDQIEGLPAAVAKLRALGYRIALDDLGAGYAGLSSVALLEPEIVKVDMSLVRGIHLSATKQKLFRAFSTLCRDLGTEIVAEGVELAEERDCLTQLGGDLYQGYLFARPGRSFPIPTY